MRKEQRKRVRGGQGFNGRDEDECVMQSGKYIEEYSTWPVSICMIFNRLTGRRIPARHIHRDLFVIRGQRHFHSYWKKSEVMRD